MAKDLLNIKDIGECNRVLGCKTLHPQAGIVRMGFPHFGREAVKVGFYAIVLFEGCAGCCQRCGRTGNDFAYATMAFLTPGEVVRMDTGTGQPGRGTLLTFHRDLLFRTDLAARIGRYTFFSYRKEEALHLSEREAGIVLRCLGDIEGELHHPVDTHSRTLLTRHIELLLDYCARFYERQFILRADENEALLDKLDGLVEFGIESGRFSRGILPSLGDCAERLSLSAAYLDDLMRHERGKTFAEYLEMKRLEAARRLLTGGTHSPEAVARHLGYRSVGQFCLLFEKATGTVPGEYARTRN